MSLMDAVAAKKKHSSAEKKAAIADVTKESLKRLNVNVPGSVYQKFKVKAAIEGRDMSAIVNAWIEDYLAGEDG